jgi:patatin-related protein
MTLQPNQRTGKKEIRFAVVMYGGASLAIYINGVAQEILKMARATALERTEFDACEKVYRLIAVLLSDEDALDELAAKSAEEIKTKVKKDLKNFDSAVSPTVRFVVDVLSGTSAGGINAVFLAKALAKNGQMSDLKKLWLKEGDISKLINDKNSIFDNALNLTSEPKSLLNSQRMYLKLLEALNGMDGAPPGEKAVNVDELDLFVTVTDYTGVPVPLRLFDKVVEEMRHKQVFHFKYNPMLDDDQLAAKYNPFLAFAARCTSAFPFAFEPMRLADIDQILEQCFPAETNKSDSPLWNDFAIEQKIRANGDGDATKDWRKRYLVDGGYLDNKPFGYAIDTLVRRQAAGVVERKLIYVDPSPELFDNRKTEDAPPDALENLKAAAMDLPRYETIREDLSFARHHGCFARILARKLCSNFLFRTADDFGFANIFDSRRFVCGNRIRFARLANAKN